MQADPWVRPYEVADRDAVVALARRLATSSAPWRDRSEVESATEAALHNWLGGVPSQSRACFVALADDRVVGAVTIERQRHMSGSIDAEIKDLVVSESHEHLGVARALMDEAEQWAVQAHVSCLVVETSAFNDRAQKLYRSRGFEVEDVRLTKVIDRET